MRAVTGGHFIIEYSEPADAANGRKYARNAHLSIVCDTAERALELLRGESPDAVVHVVRRVGTHKVLLIDESEVGGASEQ